MQHYQDEVLPTSAYKLQSEHSSSTHGGVDKVSSVRETIANTKIALRRSGNEDDVLPRFSSKEVKHLQKTNNFIRSAVEAGLGEVVGANTHRRGDWEYFDEIGYIHAGALRTGEDPYVRNRFNQEASDALPSNREIPDTRNPM